MLGMTAKACLLFDAGMITLLSVEPLLDFLVAVDALPVRYAGPHLVAL